MQVSNNYIKLFAQKEVHSSLSILKMVVTLVLIASISAPFFVVSVKANEQNQSNNLLQQQTVCPGQFRARYYSNQTMTGDPTAIRCENWPISYDWGYGSPIAGVPSDHFSVVWTGRVWMEGGGYIFTFYSDDGIRVSINNETVIDYWNSPMATPNQMMLNLARGEYTIIIQYKENIESSGVYFNWERMGYTPPFSTKGANPSIPYALPMVVTTVPTPVQQSQAQPSWLKKSGFLWNTP